MTALPHLDFKIKEFKEKLPQLKMEKNRYLLELKEVLDLYLLNVMEEEDLLYKVLCVRAEHICNDYNNLKTLTPFNIQLNILMSLPFSHSNIQVEEGEVGFIKMSLPSNDSDKLLIGSKIWIDACNHCIQGSLLRHVNLWKDKDNYLQSTAFLKWFAGVVDRSLEVTGPIPNYKITRLKNDSRVTLRVQDDRSNTEIFVRLLPVFALPISSLPETLQNKVPQDSSCNEWMVECCSNEVSDPQLWATSLWQHEKKVIKEHNLKPIIQILKGVRDIHCKKTEDTKDWNLLTNNHIRNLVMVTHKEDQLNFQNMNEGKLLLDLLLKLRNHLVSREGLPFFWDGTRNLLCGLTGSQKSSLARLVTRSIKDLQDPECQKFFGMETYAPALNILEEKPAQLSSSSSASRKREQTSSYHESMPNIPEVQPRDASGSYAEQEDRSKNSKNMWWIVAGVATVAIAAFTGYTLVPKKKKNDDDTSN